MESIIALVALCLVAVAIVVRTVFYGIETLTNAKVAKKTLKFMNKYFKMVEPVGDWLQVYMDKMKEEL